MNYSDYKPHMLVSGTIIKTENYGVWLQLNEGIEALLHINDTNGEPLVLGQKLTCKVVEADPERNRIALSLKL